MPSQGYFYPSTMQTQTGTFHIEDAFNVTGRGLVLAGPVEGEVATGQQLLLSNGNYWTIKAINLVNVANKAEKYGLLIDAPVTSRQELLAAGIIGSTVPLLSSPAA
jgi:GTPase